MDKFGTFIKKIIEKFDIWNQNCVHIDTEWRWKEEYDIAFTMEEQTIIHLNRRSKGWEQAKYDADEKIAELEKKLKYSIDASLYNSVVDRKIEKIAELNEMCRNYRKEGVAFEVEIDDLKKAGRELGKTCDRIIDDKQNQIVKLQEHIDCLENNPFRRIYNWVVSIVKYRIKLVKVGDNK